MPGPIWTGAISFGLVTIPVSLFSAVERKGELSFRLLHRKDGSPIDYKRVCEEEGVEVPWPEIVKGYEHARGEYVVLTDEDFDKARTPATQTIAISDWEPAKYRDTYRDVLLGIIEKKVAGEEVVAPKVPKPRTVVNLVRALEQSLKAPRKEPARAEGREERRPTGGAGTRRRRQRAPTRKAA